MESPNKHLESEVTYDATAVACVFVLFLALVIAHCGLIFRLVSAPNDLAFYVGIALTPLLLIWPKLLRWSLSKIERIAK